MIQGYTGWATGVNRIILDASSITLGENALKNDELENGLKRTRKRGAFCPDKFSVKMKFNWEDEVVLHTYDSQGNITGDIHTGKTEYQLFTDWYKYTHKYGSVPFEFPKILYSQDTGIFVVDWVEDDTHRWQTPSNVEYYKITSSVPGNKSGSDVEVDMTWEAVYGGTVEITAATPHIATCSAFTDHLDIFFDELGSTAPTSQMFSVWSGNQSTQNTALGITGFYYDNASTVRIYYSTQTVGKYITFSMNYPDYTVAKGTYTPQIMS